MFILYDKSAGTIAKSKSLVYYTVIYIKDWDKAFYALETEGVPVLTSVESTKLQSSLSFLSFLTPSDLFLF